MENKKPGTYNLARDPKITAPYVIYAPDKFMLERLSVSRGCSASRVTRELIREALIRELGEEEYNRLHDQWKQSILEVQVGK